jgi:DNA polymerase
MAPDGYVVIDCDSAQIEARVLAWLAGQDDLVQAFRDKQDVYKLMATKIYGIALDGVDKTQRQVGKTVVLGAGYGVGHVKLQLFLKTQAGVEVTLEEAKRIIDTYRSASYKIADFWRNAGEALTALTLGQSMQVDAIGLIKAIPGKGLTLPNGLHIQYPGLRAISNEETGKRELVYYSKGLPVRIYGGKVVENICQAVARQVVAEQMLRVSKRYKVVLTVHDAVAIIAKEEEAPEAQAYLEECMSWNPKWAVGLPLSCESGMGASYGDC